MQMNQELFNRVDALMQTLVGREGHNHNADVITQLFNLYNEVFSAREYSKSCGSCRQKVYNGLKTWWENNGGVKN